MKRSAWLVAAFLAALAVPALAGTPGAAPDAGGPPKYEYDFTKRPVARVYAPRDKAAAGARLTEKQAKALANDLFNNYQNVSGLALFRFHKRTKDEPPMTLEEISWADDGLAREAKLFDELQAEADAALQAGIERRVAYRGERPLGLAMLGRAKYIRSRKPTLDDLRRDEYHAISGIGSSFHSIIYAESEPVGFGDPKERAEAARSLAEDRADLARVRKEIQGFRRADAEREELRTSSILESKERVERATSGGFENKSAPSAGDPPAGNPPSAGGGSGGRTEEQILREANAVPRASLPRKGKPAAVPAP